MSREQGPHIVGMRTAANDASRRPCNLSLDTVAAEVAP